MKPKHHYQFHIPQQAADVNVLLDCFVTERKHHFFKQELAPRLGALATFERNILANLIQNAICTDGTPQHATIPVIWNGEPVQQTSFVQLEDGTMYFKGDIFLISEGALLVSGFVRFGSLTFAVCKLFNKVPRGSIMCSQNVSFTKNFFFMWLFCLVYL